MTSTPPDWRRLRFGEFAHVEHGWPFKSSEYTTAPGLPIVVSIGNFEYTGGFRFDRSTVKRYAGEYPVAFELNPGDLLLVMTCQTEGGEILGVPGRVPDDGQRYLHNQRIGRVIIDRPEMVVLDFLFHLARWTEFNRQLVVTASGSKILHTSPDRIAANFVELPPVEEQQAIADVLGALDDKIAANAQLIETATALSAALFSSMRATEPRPLTSVAEFVNGRAFTKDASGAGRVVVRIAELNSGISGSTVYSDAEVPDQHVARPGDILFAWSGSLTIHRWFRPEAIVNQHIFKVIPRAGYPHWLVWGLLTNRLDEFKAIAADKATTMGHIQRRHLEEPVAVPVPALVAQHNDAMTALWGRALAAEVENLTLAATRDALLPALMSGRLRVRDAASGIPQSQR